MKLTSLTTAPFVNSNSLIHVVNPSDTSQSPDGSSYKTTLSDLAQLFSNTYWSGSTGLNAIVLSNSGSIADGTNAVAEGLNNTANGHTSRASGLNSKALGSTSFVHSVNSIVQTGANRSAILGGQSITATTADTVYVPNLNINSTPSNDNNLDNVLVRANDGTIKTRTATSIQSTSQAIVELNNASPPTYTITTPNLLIINKRTNPTTIILPATAPIGSYVEILEDKNTNSTLVVQANSGQVIKTGQYIRPGGTRQTTAGGTISPIAGEPTSMKLTCTTTNTTWCINYYFTDNGGFATIT